MKIFHQSGRSVQRVLVQLFQIMHFTDHILPVVCFLLVNGSLHTVQQPTESQIAQIIAQQPTIHCTLLPQFLRKAVSRLLRIAFEIAF